MDRRMIKTILLGLVGFFLAGAISDSNAAFAGCGPFCGGKWKVIAVEHSNVKIPARTLTRAVNNFDYLDARLQRLLTKQATAPYRSCARRLLSLAKFVPATTALSKRRACRSMQTRDFLKPII